ncbi:MAG: TetR/AcrR family transcriptional regulator [Actinomycetota bacterium]
MSGQERREQLIDVGRAMFAQKGFQATSIEEIAQRAKITKPLVYEHFGGKQGLYAVVVDREVKALLERITEGLDAEHPRLMLEQAALAFLGYIQDNPEGFRVLVRDSPVTGTAGTLASVIDDVASQVEYILVEEFSKRAFDTRLAPLYSRALVGMTVQVGGWWMDVGKPRIEVVAAHLVNLAWNGLSKLDVVPGLATLSEAKPASKR